MVSRPFPFRPARDRPRILVATRDASRNQLLVARLAQSHLWQRCTEQLRMHFAECGYRIGEPVLSVVENTSWARMTATFGISYDNSGSLQVLQDLSVRQDGSVLGLLAVLRPHAGGETTSRDLVTMSTHNLGRLSWQRALRGQHRYSFAELLAQLREMRTFSLDEAWQQRATLLSESLEP